MIWVGLVAVAAIVALLLWRGRASALWAALVLAVGAGAYAMAGHPSLGSAPADPAAELVKGANARVESTRQALAADPANIALWGQLSGALIEAGRSGEAVEALNFASQTLGPNPDMQVFLGTALMAHANGAITPAAQLAFGRSSALDPEHPAPPYFLGLAHLQSGEPARAIEVWSELAARTPEGAPWQADLEQKLDAARMMQAAGVGGAG